MSAGSKASIEATQQPILADIPELRVVMIYQVAQFTGNRAAKIFFSHSSSTCSRQAGTARPPWALAGVLDLLATSEQLAGTIEQLPIPLAHLDGVVA